MKHIITMQVNPASAARGLNITVEEYLTLRQDGRQAVSYAMNYLACHGFEKIPHASYWLLRREGVIYKLRALTDKLSFSDSSMKGIGRDFNLATFLENLNNFDRFLIFDVREMPNSRFCAIKKEKVFQWIKDRTISKTAVADRKVIKKLMEELDPANS